MEASYAYPSAQSWLQSQGTCQLCGSNGYLLSGRELKSQIDLIQSKLRDVADLSHQVDTAKTEFSKSYKSAEVDSSRLLLENLKKQLQVLRDKRDRDNVLLSKLETENIQGRKLLQQTRSSQTEKVQALALKRTIASDLRLRLKELSNVLFVERMKRALTIFKMMSIVATLPVAPKVDTKTVGKDGRSVSPNPRSQQLAGCSTIMSLPLPNNGNYSDIPFDTTAVALSHIAHLVDALSAALNIPLLHPIVMVNATECMISPHYNLTVCYTLSPVTHINTRAKHEIFHWLTPAEVRKNNSGKKEGKTPEHDTSDYLLNKAFPQALTLLQANIIALCLHVGLSPDSIWPPQAMLLNLHELLVLCAKCVKRNSGPPSQSILQTTTKTRGVVEVLSPSPQSLDSNSRAPAVPLVYQQNNDQSDPVVKSLTKRYSIGAGNNSNVGYGSISLPSDLLVDEDDEMVIVEGVEEQEEEEDTSFVSVLPHTAVDAIAGDNTKKVVVKQQQQEYDEGGYGLTVEEDEYDMLDLLLESQMLAGQNDTVDTNNENELWP